MDLLPLCDHVVFNSFGQWRRFHDLALAAHERRPGLRFGLRINPEHREVEVALYDPCAPGSRLGVTAAQLPLEFEVRNQDGDVVLRGEATVFQAVK